MERGLGFARSSHPLHRSNNGFSGNMEKFSPFLGQKLPLWRQKCKQCVTNPFFEGKKFYVIVSLLLTKIQRFPQIQVFGWPAVPLPSGLLFSFSEGHLCTTSRTQRGLTPVTPVDKITLPRGLATYHPTQRPFTNWLFPWFFFLQQFSGGSLYLPPRDFLSLVISASVLLLFLSPPDFFLPIFSLRPHR